MIAALERSAGSALSHTNGYELRSHEFGVWRTTLSDEVVCLDLQQRRVLETALNSYLEVVRQQYPKDYGDFFSIRRWGVPAVVVRFDMAPFPSEEEDIGRYVYEVEANSAGFGFAHVLGVGSTERIAAQMHSFGINEIGSVVSPCRKDQLHEHEEFLCGLEGEGVSVSRFSVENVDTELPLWMRTGEEDIELVSHLGDRSLILFRDGGGQKRYLVERFGAKYLVDFSSADELFECFPDGFVVKPWRSWGTRSVSIWTSRSPWRKKSNTKARTVRQIENISSPENFVVQPFEPPAHHDGWYRIWRIFALWNGSQYEVIGGLWNECRSLLVHGTSTARFGAIKI